MLTEAHRLFHILRLHTHPVTALLSLAFLIVAFLLLRRRWPAALGCAVISLALWGTYSIWMRMPPFERGLREVSVQASVDPLHADAPYLGSCPVFPSDNVWNSPVDKVPVDPHSGAYIDSIGPLHPVHLDFGSSLASGIPYSDIRPGTPRVPIAFEYKDDSDLRNYPIPVDAPIEGGGTATGDRHVLLVDQQRCLLYELFDAHPQADGSWKAGSGVIFDLTSNALREDGKGSADAAGLPILPGLVRYEEVQSGVIRHALRFTIPRTQGAHVWPARHKASAVTNTGVAPMGVRFRLRASFDISKFSKPNQVILRALQRYGMFLADNGSAMFISGVSDKRWDDSDLHKLSVVKAEDFEAVDESGLQLLPDSARVDPLAMGHSSASPQ